MSVAVLAEELRHTLEWLGADVVACKGNRGEGAEVLAWTRSLKDQAAKSHLFWSEEPFNRHDAGTVGEEEEVVSLGAGMFEVILR